MRKIYKQKIDLTWEWIGKLLDLFSKQAIVNLELEQMIEQLAEVQGYEWVEESGWKKKGKK